MRLYIVIAKEYDYENGADHIVGAFKDEEQVRTIAKNLTIEWNNRQHVDA